MPENVVEYFFNDWIWMPSTGHQKSPVQLCFNRGAVNSEQSDELTVGQQGLTCLMHSRKKGEVSFLMARLLENKQ